MIVMRALRSFPLEKESSTPLLEAMDTLSAQAGPSRRASPLVPSVISQRFSQYQGQPTCSSSMAPRRSYVALSMLEGWFGSRAPSSSPAPAPPPPEYEAEQPDPSRTLDTDWREHEETDEERRQRHRVEGWRDDLFRTSPMLRFMARHLALVSCDPFDTTPSDNASSTPRLEITACPPNIAGGFSPSEPKSSSGILICSNRIMDKGHLEDTLAHEMVHWWDHCRFRVDWNDLRHHACSEVRAAALSGDCKLGREWTRRNYGGFTKQHQVCARRRAVLSVMANPACKGGKEEAEKVVDEVFPQCFADTRPFDEIY